MLPSQSTAIAIPDTHTSPDIRRPSARYSRRPDSLLRRATGVLSGRLLVRRLDRLSRNVRDAYDPLDRGRRMGWALVALDLGLDMTTPMGSAMAVVASCSGSSRADSSLSGSATRWRPNGPTEFHSADLGPSTLRQLASCSSVVGCLLAGDGR